jgi:hypothetical protein
MLQRPYEQQTLAVKPQNLQKAYFVGFTYQGKDIVFRFIIECISLRQFWPLSNNVTKKERVKEREMEKR